jgi:superfamily II RNA helicase
VVVQAPDHDVENAKAVAKAGEDPKKLRKIQRKKPPEGFVSWNKATFQRLVEAEPEPLVSRMRVSHSMLLNVIEREGDPFESMRKLLRDNHEQPRNQARLSRRAIQIYRTLLSAGVVERLETPDETGRTMRVTQDLQFGFALNQPLSTFALATFDVLDRESPTYALDVVSILEATLEDPRPVLSAQRYKARGEAVAQMKSEGIEYDERLELLEDVTWPQPLLELLEATFELYRQGHPWIAETQLSPKSVLRDMFERAMTFGEFVAFYGLTRSEGMVLRYLSDAYKALRQTVPDNAKTEELIDLIEWIGEVVRQTDSSLLDEWEQLSDPSEPEALITASSMEAAPKPITANERAFRVLVRNAMFRRVELAALRRWIDLGDLDPDFGQDAWQDGIDAYFADHEWIGTGPDARGPQMLQISNEPDRWVVRQVIDDPAGDHDWAVTAVVDLAASDEAGEAVLTVTGFEALG